MLDFFQMLFGTRIQDELRKIVKEPEFQAELKALAKNPKALAKVKNW